MALPRRLRSASRFLAVAAAAALVVAPAAFGQTDREDAIPASVGPGNVRGFYVNPTTPPGVDPGRWMALVQRTLRRWGDTFLGPTNTSAAAHTDRQSTIGFTALGSGQLGRTSGQDLAFTRTLPRTDQCSSVDVGGTDDTVTQNVVRKKFRLRRDIIRKNRVRRRMLTRSVERRSESVDRRPLVGTQCVTGPGASVARLDVREVDIEIGTTPTRTSGTRARPTPRPARSTSRRPCSTRSGTRTAWRTSLLSAT